MGCCDSELFRLDSACRPALGKIEKAYANSDCLRAMLQKIIARIEKSGNRPEDRRYSEHEAVHSIDRERVAAAECRWRHFASGTDGGVGALFANAVRAGQLQ